MTFFRLGCSLLLLATCLALARAAAAQSDLTGWVDRIEGDVAVVIVQIGPDELIEYDVPLSALAPDVAEGDRLIDGTVVDALREPTAAYVRALQDLLFDRQPKRLRAAGDAPKRDPGLTGGLGIVNSRRPGGVSIARGARAAAATARSRLQRSAGG